MAGSKIFYCLCDGGFGNRLNALVSGMIVWRKKFTDYKFIILWPINRYCSAELHLLVDLEILQIYFESDLEIKRDIFEDTEEEQKCFIGHESKGISGKFINISKIRSFTELDCVCNGVKNSVIFTSALIPFIIGYADLKAASNFIHPSKNVMERVTILADDIKPGSIGLHLRGTDYGFSQRYFLFWKFIIRNLFFIKFHIFSDDEEIIHYFSKLDNTFFFNETVFPEKFDHGSVWTQRYDKDYNIQRPEASVVNAAAEMFLLGTLPKLITSRSTYLYNSSYLCKREPNISFSILYHINVILAFVRTFK
jgi:hypothetical protein